MPAAGGNFLGILTSEMFEIVNKNVFQNVEGLRNPKKFPPAAGYQGIQVRNPPLLVPNLKQGRILKKHRPKAENFLGLNALKRSKMRVFGPPQAEIFWGLESFFKKPPLVCPKSVTRGGGFLKKDFPGFKKQRKCPPQAEIFWDFDL